MIKLFPAVLSFVFLANSLFFLLLVNEGLAESPFIVPLGGKPGPYSEALWRKDWPGCEWEDGVAQGRASLVDHGGRNWLRINYNVGQIGPDKGGCAWRWPIGKHDSAELRYTVWFSKDFDWVKGGKLPGLCGGPDNVSGGIPSTGTNGFSARLMWRKDGRGEVYVYHKNQASNYGDSFSFPADFRIPSDKPVHVHIAVTMNSLGKRNGILRVGVAFGDAKEELMIERKDMEWRVVDTFGVDSLCFETFHGGGDSSWAPMRKCWADFIDIKVDGRK